MDFPSLTGWADRRVNDDIPQLSTPPMTAVPATDTTIASSSNDNKKRRRASSDIQDEVKSTELNNTSSDSKRSQRAARRAEEEIKKMYLQFKREYNYQPNLRYFAHTCLTLCTTMEHGQAASVPLDASIMFYESPYNLCEPQNYALGLVTVKWLREAVASNELIAILTPKSAQDDSTGDVMTAGPVVSNSTGIGGGVGSLDGAGEQVGGDDMGMNRDTGDVEVGGQVTENTGSREMLGGEEMDRT